MIRLALLREQVDELGLPPNPAKLTDSRSKQYLKEHGTESWELDALEPKFINEMIEENVLAGRDHKKWEAALSVETKAKKKLLAFAKGL